MYEAFQGSAEDFIAIYGNDYLPGGEWPFTPIPIRDLWILWHQQVQWKITRASLTVKPL